MWQKSILTREDYEEYLVYLHFGGSTDYLTCCIDRAYLDFSRTLHGLRDVKTKSELSTEAKSILHGLFVDLLKPRAQPQDQASFDQWHQQVCQQLSELYRKHDHPLYVGQSQKWINMIFKYIFTLGEHRLPGYSPFYQFCHVPLDNIVVERLQPYGPPSLKVSWSRLDSYPEYLAYQQWMRQRFADLPLDVEFFLWLGKAQPS